MLPNRLILVDWVSVFCICVTVIVMQLDWSCPLWVIRTCLPCMRDVCVQLYIVYSVVYVSCVSGVSVRVMIVQRQYYSHQQPLFGLAQICHVILQKSWYPTYPYSNISLYTYIHAVFVGLHFKHNTQHIAILSHSLRCIFFTLQHPFNAVSLNPGCLPGVKHEYKLYILNPWYHLSFIT